MAKKLRHFSLLVAAVFVTGASGPCQHKPEPHNWTLAEVEESAVLVRPAELAADPRFSLRNVLSQLLRLSGANSTPADQEAFLATLLASLNATEFTNPESGLRMRVDRRPTEAAIPPGQLLNELVPIGLFNRIDQMSAQQPQGFPDCGEYRIVYASRQRHFLLIFESRLRNAGADIASCGKLARFWQRLEGLSPSARRDELARFYFDGIEGFQPVVHPTHFAEGLGQVRSNTFAGEPRWELREWKIAPQPGRLIFTPHPIASTALTEFYADSNASSLDPARESSERAAYQQAFVGTHARELVEVTAADQQLGGITMQQIVLATMGARIPRRFNEFQSDAQTGSDTPRAGSILRPKLPSFNAPGALQQVDPTQLMVRAGAVTCGGCHGFSGGASIGRVGGTETRWPGTVQFRHITPDVQNGQHVISPALSEAFLLFRRVNLVRFLNTTELSRASTRPRLARSRADELFESIVRNDNAGRLSADYAQWQALANANRARDLVTPGFFIPNRRPH